MNDTFLKEAFWNLKFFPDIPELEIRQGDHLIRVGRRELRGMRADQIQPHLVITPGDLVTLEVLKGYTDVNLLFNPRMKVKL